jgi:tetratricopeptide (TPR) repeat protein
MEGLKKQYASAKDKINQGRASESLPELDDLKMKLKDRISGYTSGVRAPASVRDELLTDAKALMSRVDEGVAAMRAKLKADYQVQLADAEQFVANKQYATAREIYDRILETDPNFDEVKEIRDKLYSKIIVEARNKYQEGLIYESVGDVDNAIEGYEKTKELLNNVNMFSATEYFSKATIRLSRLKR